MSRLRTGLLGLNFACTIFVSAFLLFQVQPIISKIILPWFGGSPAVWTTCMVFFQTALFTGYCYAHVSEKLFRPLTRLIVHLSLIGLALWTLPITPDAGWKPTADEPPTWRILCLLAATVGLPYFVLSSTGPLLQAWFTRALPGRSPYRLYALSNVGSLLALLSYPFYVEGAFAIGQQGQLWSAGFVLFAALCVVAALIDWMRHDKASVTSRAVAASDLAIKPTLTQRSLWLLLPAFASMMLLATTNHVCQDVAVIPFLWVVPLSLYLLSFIICFDHERWYVRQWFGLGAMATLGAVAGVDQLITGGHGVAFSFTQELVLHFAALFFLCMVCHGELVRLKPDPKYVTEFYLLVSAGGALGGMFVSLAAPALFSTFFEWKLGLVLGCLLAAFVVLGSQPNSWFRRRFYIVAPLLLVLFLGASAASDAKKARCSDMLDVTRNFYGVVRVVERQKEVPQLHQRNFYSGRIVHGIQFFEPQLRRQPTAYFGPNTGVGRAFAHVKQNENIRVGVVGLGVGSLAAYARTGDYFRFYEINPDVPRFADKYFTFLSDCPAETDVVLGDGRLSLQRESSQQFDLLVLDAFSGDAVPTHLLTREAFEIYLPHLKADSVLAVNISNRYLGLSPVVRGLAEEFGFKSVHLISKGDAPRGLFDAEWMLLARDESVLATHRVDSEKDDDGPRVLWTDDHSNLFEILR